MTFQIPKRLHQRVFNDGRTKNQLRQRFQVYVSHDGVELPKVAANGDLGRIDEEEETYSWHVIEDPSDSDETIPWKLRGSNEGNLQKAKDFLENLVSSVQDQGNCTGYLGVPPEHHHQHGRGSADDCVGRLSDRPGRQIHPSVDVGGHPPRLRPDRAE